MINIRQSKKIHLDSQTLLLLKLQAAKDGLKLKTYLEEILKEKADKMDLSDEYRKLMDSMLEKHDNKSVEYENWEVFKKTINI